MRKHERSVALVFVALVAASSMITIGAPQAQAGTTSIFEGSGVDYDAACIASSAVPPSPNSVASPVMSPTPPRWYCDAPLGASTYHGVTEATDLGSVSLGSNTSGQMVATFTTDNAPPPPGHTILTALDSPNPGQFLGARWRALFQNRDVQTSVPTNPVGGCTRAGTSSPVYDLHGSWKDGFHFYVGLAATWDGVKWVHSAEIGEYDPAPGGGFRPITLGTNSGAGWTSADPNMLYGADWSVTYGAGSFTVTVDGIVRTSNTTLCQQGFFKTVFATAGDNIAHVKGLSTVVTAPGPKAGGNPCASIRDEVCQPSGPVVPEADLVSDTTSGNSRPGGLGANITGVAYTPGQDDSTDTTGNGPTCWTPTYGGMSPANSLFTPDTACQIDDDVSGRGTDNAEFWETPAGFVF